MPPQSAQLREFLWIQFRSEGSDISPQVHDPPLPLSSAENLFCSSEWPKNKHFGSRTSNYTKTDFIHPTRALPTLPTARQGGVVIAPEDNQRSRRVARNNGGLVETGEFLGEWSEGSP